MENEKIFKNDEKRMQHVIHILMGALIILSILNAIDPHLFWKHFVRVNIPIHSSIEAMGALAAILMGFMSIRFLVGIKEPRYEMISLGFLVMGCWDLFHSFLRAGHGFVFTHNLSLLCGGVFFFLIVINWSEKSINRKVALKILLIAIIVVLGLLIKNYRNAIPLMIMELKHEGHIGQIGHSDHESGFSPLANAMNIIAGILFLISSIRIYIDFRRYKKTGLLLLSFLALLTACAGFLFSYSLAWADSWWFWHVLRLIAFIVLMAYMLIQFSIVLSERTSNLKAMQESEEKFRRLFDSEPDAIFLADPSTGILLEVNKAAEKLMKRTSSELVGMHKSELYPVEKREQITEMFKEIAIKGSQKPQEAEIIDARGEIIPVETLVIKIQVIDRQLLIGIFRDISERIKLQVARRKTEAKFSRFVELVPIPLCNIDQNTGTVKYINKAFISLLGYNEQDMPTINQWWQLAYPDPEYRKWVLKNWEQAVERAALNNTDILSDTYKVTCKNGEVRDINIGGVLIENDMLVTYVDITDLKATEQAIIDEKEMFESTIDSLPGIYYQINLQGNFVRWNEMFKQVSGYNDDEMKEKAAQDLFNDNDKERVAQAMGQVFQSGESEVEADLLTKAGKEIPYLFTGRKFMIKEDLFLIGMGLDISNLKSIEMNLRKTNIELEAFAYVASHDLQEPLRKISSFTELLQKRYSENLDERGLKYMNYITTGAKRMQQLISDLLQFSRVGTREKPFEAVDFNEILSDTQENLSVVIEEKKAVVNIGELPTMIADKSQMGQLWQNLLANALEFTAEKVPEILIDSKEMADYWLFSIRDNGIGIEQEYKDKIFVIFQRLHNQEKYSGTGIGLAICRKIVELHGGAIWFESEPEAGTTFYFTLSKNLGIQ
ncbi:MAG: PAS domain S-box protein [Candidatus Stygibacter frigidus]|nr:PAS domain S-box protein [Candidatus Stygibacter frigidus]